MDVHLLPTVYINAKEYIFTIEWHSTIKTVVTQFCKKSGLSRESLARLAGDGGAGWEVLTRDSCWIQPFLHVRLFTFLRV